MVFGYDNINGPFDVSCRARECGWAPVAAEPVRNPDGVITDGLIVCFDWMWCSTVEPVVITYQAEVEIGAWDMGTITNTAYHNTDNPGSMEVGADATLDVTGRANILTVDIVGEGSVTRTPDQVRYLPGTQVMLEAIPLRAGCSTTGMVHLSC